MRMAVPSPIYQADLGIDSFQNRGAQYLARLRQVLEGGPVDPGQRSCACCEGGGDLLRFPKQPGIRGSRTYREGIRGGITGLSRPSRLKVA